MVWTWILLAGVVVAIIGFLLDRLGLWMESKGWIYWRRSEKRGSASLWLIEEIYQPSMTHIREEEVRERTEADQDESGEA